MAIDYANLAVNPALAAEYLAQYLDDSGIFDSVTFDTSTNTVAGYLDSTEIFKAVLSSSAQNLYWRGTVVREFGSFTTYVVGKTSKGVAFGGIPSNVADWYGWVVCKSKGGIPMLIYRYLPTQGLWCATADYTSTPIQSTYLVPPYHSGDFYSGYANADYSAGLPICTTATGTETVAVADGVEVLHAYQTNIPTNLVSEITVGGKPALAIGVQLVLMD